MVRPAESVSFLLSKIGFEVSRAFFEGLEPLGIDPRHWALLRAIDDRAGQSQQAIGEGLGIPKSRMVALVDDLEERNLVERRANPMDRRVHALHPTAKGRRLLERARKVARAHEERVCAELSPAERDQLLGLLRRIAATQDLPLEVHPGLVKPPPGAS